MNEAFESLVTPIPGPRSHALGQRLMECEAPGVTFIADDFPVFWERAHGALVVDVDGNRYLDLTSAFGVAAGGHTDPPVSAAIAEQAARLIHGMGDVHPTEVRLRLLEALARLAPGDLCKSYLSTSGADAVEFALKTAHLATGKPRVIAYEGAYHGLSLGALEVVGIEKFRAPFAPLVAQRATLLPYPGAADDCSSALDALTAALAQDPQAGAVILEPIQGRGGVIVPPDGFLRGVRAVCDRHGVLLILDEIYTGFGRTGTMFACQAEAVVPDLLCVGKALGGGVPLAATIGSARVMDAWPSTGGEALHTSTFMGTPLACAAAPFFASAFVSRSASRSKAATCRPACVRTDRRSARVWKHCVVSPACVTSAAGVFCGRSSSRPRKRRRRWWSRRCSGASSSCNRVRPGRRSPSHRR